MKELRELQAEFVHKFKMGWHPTYEDLITILEVVEKTVGKVERTTKEDKDGSEHKTTERPRTRES